MTPEDKHELAKNSAMAEWRAAHSHYIHAKNRLETARTIAEVMGNQLPVEKEESV